MSSYYNNLNDEVKAYFKILSPDFPEWLLEYINTPEMQRIGKISMSCGTDYSKCFDVRYFYSNLDHSVAVALIIWHFTQDKKQTLAALFHDVATPVFKHCIDFMNGDSETQESTEELTFEILKNSKEINHLLTRDNIKLEEVCDYKIYPLCDNDLPKLSADRFEYNFSSGLTFFRVWDLDKIKKIYNDIIIGVNEDGIEEFSFMHKNICEEYIEIVSKLWPKWIEDKDRIVMQFIADICKSMNIKGYLTINDLYTLSEQEVINKILNCEDEYIRESFNNFLNTDKVYTSDNCVEDKYSINVKVKARYLLPLVYHNNSYIRINLLSNRVNEIINNFLNIKTDGWTYFDFDFKPYEKEEKVLKKV